MNKTNSALVLFTDGGARGNPGHAGIGVAIYQTEKTSASTSSVAHFDPEDLTLIDTDYAYIGQTTNNVAEYTALLTALQKAVELGGTTVHCVLDSELVVKQLRGEYRIKEPTLQNLAQQVKNVAKVFSLISYHHVRREKNKLADKLVNRAIDEYLEKHKQ